MRGALKLEAKTLPGFQPGDCDFWSQSKCTFKSYTSSFQIPLFPFLVSDSLYPQGGSNPCPLSTGRCTDGVFNMLKIMTTTHNDIVCISFNSKSAHGNPPIFIYMQKEGSLSFPMVLGSGGHGLSLLNKICVSAKWLRLRFLWSFNVI